MSSQAPWSEWGCRSWWHSRHEECPSLWTPHQSPAAQIESWTWTCSVILDVYSEQTEAGGSSIESVQQYNTEENTCTWSLKMFCVSCKQTNGYYHNFETLQELQWPNKNQCPVCNHARLGRKSVELLCVPHPEEGAVLPTQKDPRCKEKADGKTLNQRDDSIHCVVEPESTNCLNGLINAFYLIIANILRYLLNNELGWSVLAYAA